LGGVVFAHIDAIDVSDGVPLAIRATPPGTQGFCPRSPVMSRVG
jgi:hypothetical protein